MATNKIRAYLLFLAFVYFYKGITANYGDFEGYNRFITLSNHGHDNSTCLEAKTLNASLDHPCKTLQYAFNASGNDTKYVFEPGVYDLVANATFKGIYNLAIVGRLNQTNVTIQCMPEVGFAFVQSERITIQGIQFTGCGRPHKSTVGTAFGSLAHIPFIAAVFFASCKDVNVTSSAIAKSHGIGLILYDVGGSVAVTDSTFMKNSPDVVNCSQRHYANAGGGIYIEFTFQGALPPFNQTSKQLSGYQDNCTYRIEHCTFQENKAPEQWFGNKIEFPSGGDHMPFGRGGGLSVFIKGTAKNNNMTVENCNFIQNTAVWGAGMFVEFHDNTQNNIINVGDCNFTDNWSDTAGGAIRTGISIWSRDKLIENKIIHENCTFTNNSAILGGGVSHYGPTYRPCDDDDDRREVLYRNCAWINNQATLGSAIGLATSALDIPLINLNPNIKGPLIPYKATFEDCKLTGNKIIKSEDHIVIGQGALYSFTVPIVLKGTTVFEGNSNTALVMDGVIVKVLNSTTFTGNTGLSGGAIGMYGTSIIDLMPDSSLLFKNNSAEEKGGAIFIDTNGPPVVAFDTTELNTHPCFLAYNDSGSLQNVEDWKTNITFESNTASRGGGYSVYASSLQGCRKPDQPRINNQSLQWPFVHYQGYQGTPVDIGKEVATDPIIIQIERNDWLISPGEKFQARIKLIGEKNSSVQGVVKLNITSKSPNAIAELGIPSPLLLIQDVGQNNKVGNLVIKGTNKSLFDLTLRTVSGQAISTKLCNLSLNHCHPGFKISEKTKECVCDAKDILGIYKCDEDKKNVYMKAGYWGGVVNGKFDAYACPANYCTDFVYKRVFRLDKDSICQRYRNSSVPLCGECWNNHTVTLGSEQCVSKAHCNKERGWLFLVFFLLMFLFVLAVLKIRIDLFTAYLNVWLFSYQIIWYLIKENETFDPFIKFVINLANWKIHMTGLCVIQDLTNFYKLGVNYILPFYVLLVLWLLSIISKRWPNCYINNNVSYALCNLLVLCYTNITSISFNFVHYIHLGNHSWVLYYDGNIDFINDWKIHLPFTIFAGLLLIFLGFLLPCMLFCTPWFFRKFPCLVKYNLFFEVFQSCFHDVEKKRNYRWFASFYFFSRIGILLIALYVPLGPLKRSLLEASCMVVLATFLYFQPYNTAYNWLNKTDAILLGNLCLITVFSSALTSDADDTTITVLKYVIHVLAYVPLIYLVGVTAYYGRQYIQQCQGTTQHTPLNNFSDEENRSKSDGDVEHSENRPL